MNSIIVFHQSGCPACEDYVPKLRKIAPGTGIPTTLVDIGDDEGNAMADRHGVEAVPTTVLVVDEKLYKFEGDMDEGEIREIYAYAKNGVT